MNDRERFLEIMRFKKSNDAYISYAIYQDFWDETTKRWHKEGLPKDVNVAEFFGFSRMEGKPITDIFRPMPPFELQIIEETED